MSDSGTSRHLALRSSSRATGTGADISYPSHSRPFAVYRRITALLRNTGWVVNVKRVERIWRREGLKVPAKQPKRRRLWLNDGSCVRLRLHGTGPFHVVVATTHFGTVIPR